jgi:hypothetical protein
MWESRLEGLPALGLANRVRLVVADRPRARLAGLAGLRAMPRRTALLLPDCRSVHTFGMRFKLDLIWLGADGGIVDVSGSVPPWRLVTRAHARAVVEAPAGAGALVFTALAACPAGTVPVARRAHRG